MFPNVGLTFYTMQALAKVHIRTFLRPSQANCQQTREKIHIVEESRRLIIIKLTEMTCQP